MRVIAGSARSLPLRTVAGMQTRPTTDRIKETLFNILAPLIPGCRFLDLYAGSGAIGIEALSRGASSAAFVDSSRQAVTVIRANLNFTHLADKGRVIAGDVIRTVIGMDGERPFGVIFMDPPYDKGLEMETLRALSGSSIADGQTLIVVEASLETDFSEAEALGYRIERVKEYGKKSKHVFLKKYAAEPKAVPETMGSTDEKSCGLSGKL